MDFRIDALGPCRKRVAVTVPPERVREEYDRQYDEINEHVALPGFRRGRAPRKLIEKRFGSALGKEVKEKLVEAALKALVEEQKVEPLEAPQIDVEGLEVDPARALAFEFDLTTRPEFETPTYKGLEVKVPAIQISEAQVDAAVERLRRGRARLEAVADAPVAEKDILVVAWKALDGDSVVAHDDHAFYPHGRGVLAGFVAAGLDEQLLGQGPGATASAEVQVAADDPREELRGKTLRLEVRLKEVKRYVLPEVDAAFLKEHDYDDADEMRDDLRKRIQRGALRERDFLAEERLVEGLVGGIQIELPQEFVERELEGWARRKRMQLEMEGVAEDDISKQIDEARTDARSHIERDLKRHFLLDRLADAEDVKTTETDVLQAVREISQAYGRPEEEVLASFREPGRLAELTSQIRHKKVREILRREANVVEEAPAAADAAPAPAPAKAKQGRKKQDEPPASE